MLVDWWERAKPVAYNLKVISPLTPATLGDTRKSAGVAAYTAECRKHSSNDSKCQELGWVCIPLAVETYNNWLKTPSRHWHLSFQSAIATRSLRSFRKSMVGSMSL